MRKFRGNGENMKRLKVIGERARDRMREKEFHLCISLFLLQNINISHFLS